MPLRLNSPLLAALLLAAAAGGLYAQPFAPAVDQRRAVGDWLVEHVGEDDGGRLVRMTREGDDHNVEYRIGFWHGNPGPVRGGTVMRMNSMCGEYESPAESGPAAPPPTAVRGELVDRLARCGVSDEAAAATLQGFERAYALLSAWAEEAAAVTSAEAQAIADYGAETAMDVMHDPNMVIENMNLDAEPTDMNATGEPGPATEMNSAAGPD